MSVGFLSAAPVAGSPFIGLRPDASGKLFSVTGSAAWRARTVSNGSRVHCMKTWNPINNKKFEALSYLPPLSEESIAKEVYYMISKEWIPCLEFDECYLIAARILEMRLWEKCIGPTAGCRATAMEGIGRFGSCQCLDAPILLECKKSKCLHSPAVL